MTLTALSWAHGLASAMFALLALLIIAVAAVLLRRTSAIHPHCRLLLLLWLLGHFLVSLSHFAYQMYRLTSGSHSPLIMQGSRFSSFFLTSFVIGCSLSVACEAALLAERIIASRLLERHMATSRSFASLLLGTTSVASKLIFFLRSLLFVDVLICIPSAITSRCRSKNSSTLVWTDLGVLVSARTSRAPKKKTSARCSRDTAVIALLLNVILTPFGDALIMTSEGALLALLAIHLLVMLLSVMLFVHSQRRYRMLHGRVPLSGRYQMFEVVDMSKSMSFAFVAGTLFRAGILLASYYFSIRLGTSSHSTLLLVFATINSIACVCIFVLTHRLLRRSLLRLCPFLGRLRVAPPRTAIYAIGRKDGSGGRSRGSLAPASSYTDQHFAYLARAWPRI